MWALGWLQVLFGSMKFVRTCEKRARGVILDSSKPFIPNVGCKRKVIVTLSSISLLEVVRVILELLIAGKLALKTCSPCNECIQQHRYVFGASFPRGIAHAQAHCKPGALVHALVCVSEPSHHFPPPRSGVSTQGWGQRQAASWVCVPDKHTGFAFVVTGWC